MATIRQYYDTDFKNFFGSEGLLPLENNNGQKINEPVMWKILQNYDSRSFFLVYYVSQSIPELDFSSVCCAIIDNYEWVLSIKYDLSITTKFPDGVSYTFDSYIFTKRIIVYVDSQIPEYNKNELIEYAKKYEIDLIIRDNTYLKHMETRNKPLAFISHDSRDKAEIARPLAMSLTQNYVQFGMTSFH